VAINQVLIDQFIASHLQPPTELILDFDATNDPVHGHQVGRFFQGYYDEYCFLPLYVTCRDQLLVAYLRPSYIDATGRKQRLSGKLTYGAHPWDIERRSHLRHAERAGQDQAGMGRAGLGRLPFLRKHGGRQAVSRGL
ncbi:MAG: transposase, partial [SAR324 cluster bacterium]|nr:transposase [SAR324 cluster bacterium]